MEAAGVTPQVVPAGAEYPMLVTIDDLKREIGEWVVVGLNKDKIIQRVAATQAALTKQVTEALARAAKIPEIQKLNGLLETKTRTLAEAIEGYKKDAKDARAELSQLFRDSKDEHAKGVSEIAGLTVQLAEAKKDLTAAKRTIKELKKG